MPASPIPINTDRFAPGHTDIAAMSSNSPSSSISISPQTPFNSNALTVPPNSALGASPTNPGFFKWAAAAAQLGKSPPTGGMAGPTQSPPVDSIHQRGFDIPPSGSHDEHDHENHDSFEFGDFDDLRSRSWSKTRRATSLSAAPGQGGGISSMITGFGASSPPSKNEMMGSSANSAMGAMAVPSGGVLADKNSKGQGVLRRLSLSGSSFTRVSGLSQLYWRDVWPILWCPGVLVSRRRDRIRMARALRA